jgi:hypothetical protein
LPAIWDAEFRLGEPDASGEGTFVLCEINVSSVLPFPDMATNSIARTAARCMEAARQAPPHSAHIRFDGGAQLSLG